MRAAAAIALVVAAGCAAPTPPPAHPSATAAAPVGATALHLLGEAPPPPDGIGAPGTIVEALYDVCLDATGVVTRVTPAPGLAPADDLVAAALRRWSWFVASNASQPCWREHVLLGVPAVGRVVRQATTTVVARASSRPTAAPPRALATLYAGTVVDGVYKVCAGDDGRVTSVRSVASAAGADPYAMATLRATAWELVVGPLAQSPYCFAAPVHLDFVSAPRVAGVVVPPAGTRPKQPGLSIVVPATR